MLLVCTLHTGYVWDAAVDMAEQGCWVERTRSGAMVFRGLSGLPRQVRGLFGKRFLFPSSITACCT